MFSSIYIYIYGGYVAIWGTSLTLAAIAFMYLTFFVTDTRGAVKNKENGALQDPSGLNVITEADESIIQNLWKCFTVTFQKRSGYKRATLCFLLVSMSLYVFSSGESSSHYEDKSFNVLTRSEQFRRSDCCKEFQVTSEN